MKRHNKILHATLACTMAALCTLALTGCIEDSARQGAVSQVRDAIDNAKESFGKFAIKQPDGRALTVQLKARDEKYPSIQNYTVDELKKAQFQTGRAYTYETDAQNHQLHVVALGYSQALGAGGSVSADVYTCAILTAKPASADVEVKQESCPDRIQEGITSHAGDAVSP